MKLECGIARDLLPLYVEGLCSEESQAALEQHLQECKGCQACYQRMRAESAEPVPAPPAEEPRSWTCGQRAAKQWSSTPA